MEPSVGVCVCVSVCVVCVCVLACVLRVCVCYDAHPEANRPAWPEALLDRVTRLCRKKSCFPKKQENQVKLFFVIDSAEAPVSPIITSYPFTVNLIEFYGGSIELEWIFFRNSIASQWLQYHTKSRMLQKIKFDWILPSFAFRSNIRGRDIVQKGIV